MAYNYEEEFAKATKNTVLLGYESIEQGFKSKRYFDHDIEDFIKDLQKNLLWLADKKKEEGKPYFLPLVASMIGNCGPFHFYIKPIIEKILQCKSYITVGYVYYGSRIFHEIQLSQIEEAITNKIFPFNHHIWLTLDSGEILDITFPMTYNSIMDNEKFVFHVNNNELPLEFKNIHPSKFPDWIRYHPIAVGEDILKAAGHDLNVLAKKYVYENYPEF
jgi:hypothetical protein